MKRSTRRYILVFLFLLGLALKKSGIGLSVFLTFPTAIMMSIEMIRSAYTHKAERRLQLTIFILFSALLLAAVFQLQYWISPSGSGMITFLCWIPVSIVFLLKARSGWMQNVMWVVVTILLSTAAFMNPRQYHNFYKHSRYEDYIRRRYTETERSVADMYIDRYKKIDKEASQKYFRKAEIAEKKADLEQALNDYNKAVDYNPDDAQLLFRRGYFKLVNFELNHDLAYDAIKDFDRAIRLDTTLIEAYSNRSVALGYVGQKWRAKLDWDEVIRINPERKIDNAIRKNRQRRKK
ncbi:MAG: tetratricopeptide repeat protein [Bacteroidetes bacterium]|nr:tetratricopeptide repeat protein [Bacteroidota bacterium]